MTRLLSFTCLFLASLFLQAQSHLLDPAFNGDGWHTMDSSGLSRLLWDVVGQPDGKLIVAGEYSHPAGMSYPALTRFTSTGSLDLTFAGTGLLYDTLGIHAGATSIALQSTGNIVIGGFGEDISPLDTCSFVFTLFRYLPTGQRDLTFGDSGMVQTYPGDGGGILFDLAILPDDRILAAGYWGYQGLNPDFMLVRYLPDGDLDSTFGTNGRVHLPVGTNTDIARSVLLQPDGRILLAGYAQTLGERDAAVVRLLPNGATDPTFGNGGKFVLSLPSSVEDLTDLCLLPNGKVFAVGTSYTSPTNQALELRLLPNGSLDPTYASIGYAIYQLFNIPNANTLPEGTVSLSDGKVLVAGAFGDAASQQAFLLRRDSLGNLDPSFNTFGFDTLAIGNNRLIYKGIAKLPDGKVACVGNSRFATINASQALVARYLMPEMISQLELGLEDFSLIASPNPTTSRITLHWPGKGHASLGLVASDGRIVLEQDAYDGSCSLDLSGLPAGSYWVYVLQESQLGATRIVRQ